MESLRCPLDRVFPFETKSGVVYEGPWRLHTGSLGEYVSKRDPELSRELRTLKNFKETKKGTLNYEGIRYRSQPVPDLVWALSPNDANFLFVENLKKGHPPNPNRHLHTDFSFANREVHIDFMQWREGPDKGFQFIVFSNDQFVTKGGRFYGRYAGGLFNWSLAGYIGENLITVEEPFEVGSTGFESLNMRFWSPR